MIVERASHNVKWGGGGVSGTGSRAAGLSGGTARWGSGNGSESEGEWAAKHGHGLGVGHVQTPTRPQTPLGPDEKTVWHELRVSAKPQTAPLGDGGAYRADSVNFQPCPTSRTQDRYVVRELEVKGKRWSFTGVFDGHLGDPTVEHVAHHLPIIVRDFLRTADDATLSGADDGKGIAELFRGAIQAFDQAIAKDVLDLFGGSLETLEQYEDADIQEIINDWEEGGVNYRKVRLCMYGTTALVALVDPEHQHLWVANLGDCQAILVSPGVDSRWNIEHLTQTQNGDNEEEVARIRASHPGEKECVVDSRVLGALAPTRCFGDIPFKLPPTFTRRILFNLYPGFKDTTPWEEFLKRNLTPPYVTAEPEIIHRRLDGPLNPLRPLHSSTFAVGQKHRIPSSILPHPASQPSNHHPRFLILASDGFTDLCEREGQSTIIESWANGMMLRHPGLSVSDAEETGAKKDNMALRLLRRTIGGEDRGVVGRILMADEANAGGGSWIDDTSIVVQTL